MAFLKIFSEIIAGGNTLLISIAPGLSLIISETTPAFPTCSIGLVFGNQSIFEAIAPWISFEV